MTKGLELERDTWRKPQSLHLGVQQIFNFNNVQDNQGDEKIDEAFLKPISDTYGMCN